MKIFALILLSFSFMFAFANPDLVIRNVRPQDPDISTVPPPGEGAVVIEFEVANIGDETAQRFRILGFAAPSRSCSNNNGLRYVDEITINQLAPGQSLWIEFALGSAPGESVIHARVIADYDRVIIENNESNNCNSSFILRVTYPDLFIPATIGSNRVQFVPGEVGAELVFGVSNRSGVGANWAAGASTTALYLSPVSSNPSEADRLPNND